MIFLVFGRAFLGLIAWVLGEEGRRVDRYWGPFASLVGSALDLGSGGGGVGGDAGRGDGGEGV